MNGLNKMERKFGRFAIPGLIKYIVAIMAAGTVLYIINPAIYEGYLALDFYQIAHGQVWRLVTFLMYPMASLTNIVNLIFFAIMLSVYYFIGNTLERIWGAFRFNLYIFSGIILTILAALGYYLVTGPSVYNSIYVSYSTGITELLSAMFLTFAFLFPDTQFLLYFIIPIKAKWLGYLYLAMTAYEAYQNVMSGDFLGLVLILAAMINFLFFFLISRKSPAGGFVNYGARPKAKKKVVYRNGAEDDKVIHMPRHRCAICGKTDRDDPEEEFRYCSKCDGNYEYCSEHLYTHQHVHKGE